MGGRRGETKHQIRRYPVSPLFSSTRQDPVQRYAVQARVNSDSVAHLIV